MNIYYWQFSSFVQPTIQTFKNFICETIKECMGQNRLKTTKNIKVDDLRQLTQNSKNILDNKLSYFWKIHLCKQIG